MILSRNLPVIAWIKTDRTVRRKHERETRVVLFFVRATREYMVIAIEIWRVDSSYHVVRRDEIHDGVTSSLHEERLHRCKSSKSFRIHQRPTLV